MRKLSWTLFAGLLAFQLTAVAGLPWMTDLPKAQEQARKENKLVLLDFTGSDWCTWCQRLDKEVFSTKEFASFAKTNLVLVEIDFPDQKKQRPSLKKANEALQQKFQAESYPTIIVLNSEGKEVWRQVGYLEGGPKVWLTLLSALKRK